MRHSFLAQPRSSSVFSRAALALFMVAAGIPHFAATGAYVRIMPDYLPWHRELVYLSGVFEILFGLALPRPNILHRTRSSFGEA